MGKAATLIDTGNEGEDSYLQLKKALNQYGLQFLDLDRIILTHMHTDHSGGVFWIQQEADIPIYVHEQARYVLEGGQEEYHRIDAFFTNFLTKCGAEASKHKIRQKYREEKWKNVHYLVDGDHIPAGGYPFEVVYVPGHSQSDILLWNQHLGITLAGDHLIDSFSVNAFIEPPSPGSSKRPRPLLDYRSSFEKIRSLPLGMIYPGHGEAFENHEELIDRRLSEQENRCNLIRNALRNSEKTIFELCGEIYPRLKGKMIFLGLSQIQGHLDLMESRSEVEVIIKQSCAFYKLCI